MMTLTPDDMELALYQAAAQATLAPSIHNTQPWQFIVRPGRLDVRADRTHGVPVIDPFGRQLAISCGAAIFGARVALAARNFEAVTTVLPDPDDTDLLASITVVGSMSGPDATARRLDQAASARHSNRRRFAADCLPDSVLDLIVDAARIEGAWLGVVLTLDDRIAVARLSQRADARQNADPAYRAELRNWVTSDLARRDGVPVAAVPHTNGAAHDDIPIRDFDTQGLGALPDETRSTLSQSLVVLGTDGDEQRDWLIAGQALGRILLELTSAGYVASVLSQIVEQPDTRQQLRQDLRLSSQPALLLRAGIAAPTSPSPRRPLTEVISKAPWPAVVGQHASR